MKWQIILAAIKAIDGKAPAKFLLFKAGWNEVEGEGKYLVDQNAYDRVTKRIARRGNDIVIDYEHQTIGGGRAPAGGWIKKLTWEEGEGIMAVVEWTAEAADYIAKGEYRFFSPVFFVDKKTSRLAALHSVALTNSPKHNHLTPILAKLGTEFFPTTTKEEETMDFFKKLFTKLGLKDGSSEDDVFGAITKLTQKPPETKEVVAKEVLTALDLSEADTSTVVASIHALKQTEKSGVSVADFKAMQAKLAQRDADEAVARAVAGGKITPDQKEWAAKYAMDDPDGFKIFVAKAPVVIPLGDLPGAKKEPASGVFDETTLVMAKMFGNTEEDLKKYA